MQHRAKPTDRIIPSTGALKYLATSFSNAATGDQPSIQRSQGVAPGSPTTDGQMTGKQWALNVKRWKMPLACRMPLVCGVSAVWYHLGFTRFHRETPVLPLPSR